MRSELSHYFKWDEARELLTNDIIGWLDRQAAITEREWERACDAVKAERDALASERDYCRRRYRERVDRDRREGEELRGRLRIAGRERQLPEGIAWPRFEDGALVKYGDIAAAGRIQSVQFFNPDARGSVQLSITGTDTEKRVFLENGERVQRPPLLAADGEPVEVGQVLYGGDGRAWEVYRLERGESHPVCGREPGNPGVARDLKPEWLTHEKPDSWERLAADIRNENMRFKREEIAVRIEKLAGGAE